MLKEVSGDILLTKAQVIAHGVAPGDHFDSGLALGLRERWPAMFKDFRHYCKVGNPKAGQVWSWRGLEGGRIVALLTQEPPLTKNVKPGPASLKHVNHALKALVAEIAEQKYESVALPRLATGVGKLDWEDVRPLIDQHLGKLGIPVIIYSEFHAGVEADEGLVKS